MDNNNHNNGGMTKEERIAYYNRSNEVIVIDQKPTFVVINDSDSEHSAGIVGDNTNTNENGVNGFGNYNNNNNLNKSIDFNNNNSLSKSIDRNNNNSNLSKSIDKNNLSKSIDYNNNNNNNNDIENNNNNKNLNESDDKRYQFPLPDFIKDSKMMSHYADQLVPKFPRSIRDRINPFTLVFRHRNKDVRSCWGLPKVGWSTDIKPSTKSAAKKSQNYLQEQNLPPHFLHRNDPLLDNLLTEGQFERYFNIISKSRVRVLISVAVILQIFMSIFTYLKFGDYVLKRDAGITTELVVTIIAAFVVIVFPKATSRGEVVYLQILLLTNNITRIWWEDWFPPYEPAYQIYLWVNFSVPTAKFWRSSITGFVGIAALVIIRLIQQYDSVVNIIISQGGSYLLYHISVAFGTRLYEISNKALFAELVQANPSLAAHKSYLIFEKYYDKIANRFTQRFRDKEMEQGFLNYYSSESIIEVGVVLSTLVTSVYYVIQDIRYHKPGTLMMFLLLRFMFIAPSTLGLLYLSILRRKSPHRADIISLLIFIAQVGAQYAMYLQVNTWEGSLYYFGGVMRVLTLGVNQLFLRYLLILVPFTVAIIPISLAEYGSTNTNQILFFIIFVVVVACFSVVREKNQRMRYLVQNYAEVILKEAQLQQVVVADPETTDTKITKNTNNNNNNNNDEIELTSFNASSSCNINSASTNSNVHLLRSSNNHNRSNEDLSSSNSSLSLSSNAIQHKGKRNILNSAGGANTSSNNLGAHLHNANTSSGNLGHE